MDFPYDEVEVFWPDLVWEARDAKTGEVLPRRPQVVDDATHVSVETDLKAFYQKPRD